MNNNPNSTIPHKAEQANRKDAILLIAFGTSNSEARNAFLNIEKQVKHHFPSMEIRWAFTSDFIRKKLYKKGITTHSPQHALSKLADEEFTHIAVQSLHIIPGAEYDKLQTVIAKKMTPPSPFQKISLGQPLLSDLAELEPAMKLMLELAPKERTKEDAVILIGHGTPNHPSDAFYPAANKAINKIDQRAFLGTIESHPSAKEIAERCKNSGIKKAYLIPFLTTAGNHVKEDIIGSDENSWKSQLEKENIECIPILKGIAEFPQIVDIWIDNLKKALG